MRYARDHNKPYGRGRGQYARTQPYKSRASASRGYGGSSGGDPRLGSPSPRKVIIT